MTGLTTRIWLVEAKTCSQGMGISFLSDMIVKLGSPIKVLLVSFTPVYASIHVPLRTALK